MKRFSIIQNHLLHRALLPLLFLCGFLATGCGTMERFNDAVRIRPEREVIYERTPGTAAPRNGRTLRGTVLEVQIVPHSTLPDGSDTMLVFLDAALEDDRNNYERIPIGDVERIASLFSLPPDDRHGNIDLVESYSTTEQIPSLRRVPVRNYIPYLRPEQAEAPPQDCGCLPIDISIPFPEFSCPQREYQWYFAELRGVYTAFNDKPGRESEQGREAYLGEIAAGIRFGGDKEWGIGAAFSSGLASYDSYNSTEILRPILLLHARYQTPGPVTNLLGICMKPFVYGQLGASIDKASINLMKFNLSTTESCGECGDMIRDLQASGDLGDVDLRMPITFGFGFGIDIPLASFIDISADVGWRSLGIGENAELGGWTVPSLRRINMLYMRAGVTF